jgi:hypothetical protein
MAKDHGPSVKDDELYEKLREEGESKEKAARIANAKAAGEDVSKKGPPGRFVEPVVRKIDPCAVWWTR